MFQKQPEAGVIINSSASELNPSTSWTDDFVLLYRIEYLCVLPFFNVFKIISCCKKYTDLFCLISYYLLQSYVWHLIMTLFMENLI